MRRKIVRSKFKRRAGRIWPCAVARKLAADSGWAAVIYLQSAASVKPLAACALGIRTVDVNKFEFTGPSNAPNTHHSCLASGATHVVAQANAYVPRKET